MEISDIINNHRKDTNMKKRKRKYDIFFRLYKNNYTGDNQKQL